MITIEPLIGGLIPNFQKNNVIESIVISAIEPLIGGLTYPCGNEQLVMRK